MSVLAIGPDEVREISAALHRAAARPTPWMMDIADGTPTSVLMLADRKPGVADARDRYPAQHVMLGTYRAAITFEHQPAGLMRHLSVSTHATGKVPNEIVMQMVCAAFGFTPELCASLAGKFNGAVLPRPSRVWVEEFAPGRMAINVIELEL